MARQINCTKCNKYLGEIRDAKLAKGIVYCCADCDAKQKVNDIQTGLSNIHEMLKGLKKNGR